MDVCGKAMGRPDPVMHAFSVDVEDWNNSTVLALEGVPARVTEAVVVCTERLLDLLASYNAKATWFVLGEVADAFPGLVRRIAEGGHELGVHGYHHTPVWQLDRAGFEKATRQAKRAVEAAAGVDAWGYRAAAFSLGVRTPWAFEVLAAMGFRYDSSLFPFQGRRYGDRNVSLEPEWIPTASGSLLEIPLSVVDVAGLRLPCCGGGYLRHFPLAYTRWALKAIGRRRRAVFYIHPYELDLGYDCRYFAEHLKHTRWWRWLWIRFSQRHGRRHTETKLRWLLDHAAVGPIRKCFEGELARGDAPDGCGTKGENPGWTFQAGQCR